MSDVPVVFVVDDDEAIRKSLRWLIESADLKVETHASAQEFLDTYDPDVPGCLVLDVRMPDLSGLDLQDELRARRIEIPIIVVTGYGDVPMAVRAMKAGACEFMEKPVGDQLLLNYIHQAIAKDRDNRQSIAEHRITRARMDSLTQRERQVMQFVVAGMPSKEIATRLDVTVNTIDSHRAKIMKKMKAKGVAHLIRMKLSAPEPV